MLMLKSSINSPTRNPTSSPAFWVKIIGQSHLAELSVDYVSKVSVETDDT